MTTLPPTPGPVGAGRGVSPTRSVSVPKRWVASVTLAGLGLWAGFFGPIQVLLAQQAQVVSPDHKEFVFGVVTGVGSAVSVVANPLFGALSDRTTSRFGRRVPWVVVGALLGRPRAGAAGDRGQPCWRWCSRGAWRRPR